MLIYTNLAFSGLVVNRNQGPVFLQGRQFNIIIYHIKQGLQRTLFFGSLGMKQNQQTKDRKTNTPTRF